MNDEIDSLPPEQNGVFAGFDAMMLEKRERLFALGISPYPYAFPERQTIQDVIHGFRTGESEGISCEGLSGCVAGRIWSKRGMGKTLFWDLRDETGKIQLYLNKASLEKSVWEALRFLDRGDIMGVKGSLFRTKAGELSINVSELQVLCKSVVPIPIGKEFDDQVRHRVSDPEVRYRERYLHWMLHEEDRERIRKRTRIISAIRRRMESAGFLEVQTPTIEPIYGGAEARPFQTSIWALGNQNAYLRISPELYLKRYIIAGFNKVFSICQNFRNEGIDHSHNPEFSMMEWYEAFTDYNTQMDRFEHLVAAVCQEICGSTTVNYQGTTLEFSPPWRRITILDAIREHGGIDATAFTAKELAAELRRRGGGHQKESTSWGESVAALFELTCERHLIQPTFVLDHPLEISPLTKRKRGDDRLVERFEPFVCGMEIGNAYSELTDPVDQLDRLRGQRSGRAQHEEYENHPLDLDFVRAIGCGMPPTGGVGLGVDRLIMIFTDAPNIRDIIPFPMVKPRFST